MPSDVASLSDVAPEENPGQNASASGYLIDLQHQLQLLRGALQSEKRRVGFLLGAGCPLGIYDEKDRSSLNLIPDVAGLTGKVQSALTPESAHRKAWDALLKLCTTEVIPQPHVEHVLTQLRTCCSLSGLDTISGVRVDDMRGLDREVCRSIKGIVSQVLPGHRTSYHRLAIWMQQLARSEPLELFTPNYDLLLEQAMELHRIPYYDGFVGSHEPFFDPGSIQSDVLPSEWVRLWKIHGSINWVQNEKGRIYRGQPSGDDSQLLIYPSHLKYDQSRRMPYLAMMDRLRQFFACPNVVMIISGYSFSDEHLTEVILDGLRTNRSSHAFALMYPSMEMCGDALQYASTISNMTILAEDGGVVGGRVGHYRAISPDEIRESTVIACPESEEGEMTDDVGGVVPKCKIGDFQYMTKFLEDQVEGPEDE